LTSSERCNIEKNKQWRIDMKAPGKAYRKGLTLLQVTEMLNDEQKAKEWLAEQRWKGRPQCPHCGSTNVQSWI